jgi:NADP-dependent 3-hydroxy acid dehydrogenase YdfG
VYAGVTPLTADDVAECIRWVAARPPHVNVDQLVVLARDQAGARQVHRRQEPDPN